MRRPRRARPMRDTSGPRVNEAIRAPRVMVVDSEGKKVGEFMAADALQFARDQGLDLVEVVPTARPPVCKVTDYGKLKYQQSKAASRSRRNQSQPTMKEVKVRPKTDDHDLAVKTRHAKRFLERGDRVKVTVWFRGREHAHHDIGAAQCRRIYSAVEDIANVERHPHMDGRRMHMVLSPI